MAIIQGNWSKLLSPGLAKAYEAIDGEAIEYTEVWEKGKKPYLIKRWADNDGCLHVFDLGDGMLVPCQLVRDLFER